MSKQYSKNIGSGKLPNKYYVTGTSDFMLMDTPGELNWAGDSLDIGSVSKEFGIYTSYREAMKRVNELASEHFGHEPVKDKINTLMIEDHISGQIYTLGFYGYPSESKWGAGYKFEIEGYTDTNYTEKVLGDDFH